MRLTSLGVDVARGWADGIVGGNGRKGVDILQTFDHIEYSIAHDTEDDFDIDDSDLFLEPCELCAYATRDGGCERDFCVCHNVICR